MAGTTAFTASGTKFRVSATEPATLDQAGFQALSYTTVEEIVDIPEHGRVYNEVAHTPVGGRATFKLKGNFNEGSVTLVMAKSSKLGVQDPGQAIVESFLNLDSDLSVEEELNDNPLGTSNTKRYYQAKVIGMPLAIGAGDNVVNENPTLSISGEIIKVPAVT